MTTEAKTQGAVMNTIQHKFAMGSRLKSMTSGFTGIVTGITYYFNGCLQYLLQPPVGKDGKSVDGIWVDEQALAFVDQGIAPQLNPPTVAKATTGGADSPHRRTR